MEPERGGSQLGGRGAVGGQVGGVVLCADVSPMLDCGSFVDGLDHVSNGGEEDLGHHVDPDQHHKRVCPLADCFLVDLRHFPHGLGEVEGDLGGGQL